MNCERMREQIPELLAGQLEGGARALLVEHMDACPACRQEAAGLEAVWKGLEDMDEPEPGPALRRRFQETLGAWQEGFREGRRSRGGEAARRPVEAAWWWGWRAVAAGLLVAAGALGGRYVAAPGGAAHNEMAQLRGQVESLRGLVALSLLQEQSASARLRGVAYSYQLARPARDVEQALLGAVNHDSNVNVRLAAVDALAGFTGDAEARRALAEALPREDSPLVAIALVDWLARANAREAAPALLGLARNSNANEAVRKRAAEVLEEWGGVQ